MALGLVARLAATSAPAKSAAAAVAQIWADTRDLRDALPMPAPSGFRFTLPKPPREESIALLAAVPRARREAILHEHTYNLAPQGTIEADGPPTLRVGGFSLCCVVTFAIVAVTGGLVAFGVAAHESHKSSSPAKAVVTPRPPAPPNPAAKLAAARAKAAQTAARLQTLSVQADQALADVKAAEAAAAAAARPPPPPPPPRPVPARSRRRPPPPPPPPLPSPSPPWPPVGLSPHPPPPSPPPPSPGRPSPPSPPMFGLEHSDAPPPSRPPPAPLALVTAQADTGSGAVVAAVAVPARRAMGARVRVRA